MEKVKCPKCGELFEIDNNLVSQVTEQEVARRVAAREKELKESNDILIKSKLLESTKEIESLKKENKSSLDLLKIKLESEYSKKISELNKKIDSLNNELNTSKKEEEYKIKDAVNSKDIEITKLKNEIDLQNKQQAIDKANQKQQYDVIIKGKDQEIAFYKDLKTKMSTKLVGETLEQHCMIQFNSLRTAMYPNAYFEKDNEVSKESGSKGDFIFRDYIDDINYISIMFEMKNENDTTATKKKNEDFFKELDKDRNEKGCEYAVLVSMLEPESDLYNAGIVDVSYKYKKMYVVRPQCFISIISLLCNAAKNSIEYQKQLQIVKNQNIDISNFEDKLTNFQERFSKNYSDAKAAFNKAIEEIDKTIDHLQKVKSNLIGSDRDLRLANDKAQELTIRKLTWNNKTMKEKFDQIKEENNKEINDDNK